jgi:outer membrane protein OmpA-like peptidoglycan-associated protein
MTAHSDSRTSGHSDYIALKNVLFGRENALLEELRKAVSDHDARVGTSERLTESVAVIVADALRAAGVRNRDSLSLAISPVIIDGIRREIRNSRNEMVDALYPIMGRLAAAYVLSVFRDFTEATNRRIESGLSGRFLRLRIKSLLTGESYAQLLLKESAAFRVEEIMLIEAGRGVLLDRWAAPDILARGESPEEDAARFTAMIAAINRFSTEALRFKHQELRGIDAGDSQVHFRTAGKYLFAVRSTGSRNRKLLKSLDDAIVGILEVYNPAMTSDDSDEASRGRRQALLNLAEKIQQTLPEQREAPVFAIALFSLIGVLLAGWIGLAQWEKVKARRIYQAAADAVKSQPGIAGYPVSIAFDTQRSRVAITGLVPSRGIKDELEQRVAMRVPEVPLESTLLVIPDVNKLDETSAKAIMMAKEMEALKKEAASKADSAAVNAALLIQQAELSRQRIELSKHRFDLAALTSDYQSPERRLARWVSQNAVFFGDGTQFRDPDGVRKQLLELRDLLSPATLRLRLIGFTDPSGTAENNDQLGYNRAKAVADELIKLGVPASRLSLVGRAKEGLIVNDKGATSSNRRVEFGVVFANEELK